MARLKRELARVTEGWDILKKAVVSSGASPGISCAAYVSGVTGEPERLLYLAASAESPRANANRALVARMRVLHQPTRKAYGTRKMGSS